MRQHHMLQTWKRPFPGFHPCGGLWWPIASGGGTGEGARSARRARISPQSQKKRNVLESQDVKDPALRDPHLGDDGQGEEREVHEGVLDRAEPPGMLFESA